MLTDSLVLSSEFCCVGKSELVLINGRICAMMYGHIGGGFHVLECLI